MEISQLVTEMKADVLGKLGKFTDDLEGVKERFDKLQCQVDCIDASTRERVGMGNAGEKSVGQLVIEHPGFAEYKASDFRGHPCRIPLGRGAFEMKATISNTGLGTGTSGVIMPVRLPGVVGIARQALRIRDLMTVRPLTTGSSFDYPKMNVRTNAASPQVETSPKAESTYGWVSVLGNIATIAHYVNVSRQALDDIEWLKSTIDSELLYGLAIREESEILAGDGLGVHLNGIITQAAAYVDPAIAGDTKLDRLRHAILQARLAGKASYPPDGIIVHPSDLHTIDLIKDAANNIGNYVVGDPKVGPQLRTIWGLPAVESESISAGTFLIGPFGTGAILVDRMSATIEISFENGTNFINNVATILCESRIGLAVTVPSAFIRGSY